jgi:hypothetical protein
MYCASDFRSMRSILHIVTQPNPDLVGIIDAQKAETGVEVQVVDLAVSDVNFDQLLEQIFAADSVQVW